MTDENNGDFHVYESLEAARQGLNAPATSAGSVVTIGNFDGVHRGHQAIFSRVRALADARQEKAVALSFSPHPVRHFRPDLPPFRLTTDAQKAALVRRYGLDALVLLPFNAEFAALSPEEFVQQVLRDGLGASYVVVGEGFAFGKGRAGNTETLKELGGREDIKVEIAQVIAAEQAPVSSTRVRDSLKAGDVQRAEELLGRPFQLSGVVVHGDQRGRELGFPTANIDSPNPLLPAHGIYITRLYTPNYGPLESLTSIGTRPTFSGEDVRVETFVLAGQVEPAWIDLYDQEVELDFLAHIRPEEAFDTAESLVEKMHEDVAKARAYFARD